MKMKKLIYKFTALCVVVLILSVATTATSCNKEINCKAVITVIRQGSGDPVVGAQVELTSGDVTMPSTTDGSGTATFETNLPMILDIWVNGNNTGRVARFEDDKTDNVTIEIP